MESNWGGGSDAALSVSAVTRHLAALVREDVILQDEWLRGEITNLTRASSGHLYFSLKDSEALLSCVMFRSAAWRLRFRPEAGTQVLAHGVVEVYPQRGQYQLVVDTLRASGQGAAHQALELARGRLMQEGLLDPLRKRPLPLFPQTVAVVTSTAGAAIHDICATLQASPYPPEIIIVPTQVQGADAEAGICRALKLAGQHAGADVVLLARGGGGSEDLHAFNSELVAREICASPLPVVSAVGHETDTTLADLAADLRAATPTGAAELISNRRHNMMRRGQDASRRAAHLLEARVESARLRFDGLMRRSPMARPEWTVEMRRQRLDDINRQLAAARAADLKRRQGQLALAAGRLDALSPLATLSRGYGAVTRQPSGQLVTSAAQVRIGDGVRVRLADGQFEGQVTAVEKDDE